MSLFNVFDIAGSGMSAQTLRLETIASNLSNSQTVAGSEKEVYKAKQPIFQSIHADQLGKMENQASGGVKVVGIAESNEQAVKLYQPNNPVADKDGFVYRPNINTVGEMTDMISASKSYEMNVQMLQTLRMLAQKTLQVGK